MSAQQYTITQVTGLRDQFQLMIQNVIIDMINADQSNVLEFSRPRTYTVFTNEEKTEAEVFEFTFKKNPVDNLITGKDLTNRKAWNERPIATATTFVHGQPWAITFQQEDFDKSNAEIEKDESAIAVADQFLERIMDSMGRGYYNATLREEIKALNDVANFEGIKEKLNGLLDVEWGEHGYRITAYAPHPTNGEELVVLANRECFDMIPPHQQPTNKHVDICQRYVDQLATLLLVVGLVGEEFTWTIK